MPLVVLLVALVLLGLFVVVALAATGRGGELETARPARPGLGLPGTDEELRPEDLSALRFAVVLRGYRPDEVEQALDRAAAELAARDARLAALEEELQRGGGAHVAAAASPASESGSQSGSQSGSASGRDPSA